MKNFDICFLNRSNHLSCQMSGLFENSSHALFFAREVILARSCNPRFFGAEVHSGDMPTLIAGSVEQGSIAWTTSLRKRAG